MSLSFYTSIIEEEKKLSNIKNGSLKIASKKLSLTYSAGSLAKGSTFLDYNIPTNRCAYLYRYATIHTKFVTKYFKSIIEINSIRAVLEYKKELKIVCLGGGPGSDIVGIFRALSSFPTFEKKITHVTVLDLCGGWRNSFNHIISRLKHGKVEDVPSSLIDSTNFMANLIEVNLLEPLPAKVSKVISNADIITMVKFVSAVAGKEESMKALKIIGKHIKLGSLVLFIDNFNNKLFTTIEGLSKQSGFSTILGPLEGKGRIPISVSKEVAYGFPPLSETRVSVVGWIKTHIVISNLPVLKSNDYSVLNDEDSWDTESEDEDRLIPLVDNVLKKCQVDSIVAKNNVCEKFTQTCTKYFENENVRNGMLSEEEIKELSELIGALYDLLRVLKNKRFGNIKAGDCLEIFYKSVIDILKNILPLLDSFQYSEA